MQTCLAPSWIFSYLQLLGLCIRGPKMWKFYTVILLLLFVLNFFCAAAVFFSETPYETLPSMDIFLSMLEREFESFGNEYLSNL